MLHPKNITNFPVFQTKKKRGNNLGSDSTPILHHLDFLLDLRIMDVPFEMPRTNRIFPIHDESNDKTKNEILCCLTCE